MNNPNNATEQAEHLDADMLEAARHAARVLNDRAPLLASLAPHDQAKAHRLALALAELLAAEAALIELETAEAPPPLLAGFVHGIDRARMAWRPAKG